MRLLLVEDDGMLGESVRHGLQQQGHAEDWVRDGNAAELAAAGDPYDVVLLDLGLPGKGGLEVLRQIRRRGNRVPVLILTAQDTVPDRVAGLDAGADDYLVKPFHQAELLARMKSLLARFGATEGTLGKPPLGRMIAFYGAKGGVGATTVAINTAIALHLEHAPLPAGLRLHPVV